MKICLNCGDKLLDLAKKCPTCGAKAKDFPIVDKNDVDKIQKIVDNAPTPKSGIVKIPSFISEKQAAQKRIAANKANAIACCPKCGSTSLTANKKGFGIGKAVIGASVIGGIGLVAGNLGASKVKVTCLNCGHQFMPGK